MRMPWCSILSALLLVSLTQANPVKKSDDDESAGVIPSNSIENGYPHPETVYPTAYSIVLEPHLAGNDSPFTFNGQSAIDVIIGESTTNTIILHAVGLSIIEDFTTLLNIKNNNIILRPKKQTIDSVNEILTIEFPKSIAPGAYTLSLKYIGELKEEHKGFYRVKRPIDGQEDVWEAFTQFKPSYARRAFPCFDETAIKARFTIYIKLPKNYVANSTTLAVREPENGDKSSMQLTTSDLMLTNEIDFKIVYAKPDVRPDSDATSTSVAPTTPTSTTVAPTTSTSTTVAPTTSASTTVAPTTPTSTTVAPTTPTSTTVAPTTPTSTTVAPTTPTSTTVAPTTPTSTTVAPTTPTATTVAPTTSTTDESSGSSTTDESSGSSTTDESSGSSTTDESSGSSTVDESSGSSTVDESSGSSTVDESSGSSTPDESSESSTTDESSGSSTSEASPSDPSVAPSTTGAANISLPTLPLTIFTGLLARLVAQAL